MKVVVHVDGGARGNPGPAAAAAVISTPDGEVLDEAAERIGAATNNVAEYRGAAARARARAGARRRPRSRSSTTPSWSPSRSTASYKVKHADMKPLHAAGAARRCGGFERWSIRSVPRAQNAGADALVNQALDADPATGGAEPVPAPPERETRGRAAAAPTTRPTC